MANQHQSVEPLLDRIKQEFPDISWATYRYNSEGWDHEVIILDEKIIFRFPIESDYRDQLKDEIEVLKFLAPQVPVAIPSYTYVAHDGSFAGYEIIPGTQLKKADFDRLSTDEQKLITKRLADFLSCIHMLDRNKEALKPVAKSYLLEDQRVIRKHMSHLQTALTPEDYRLAESILAEVDSLLNTDTPVVFTHADLYSSHILWDQISHRVGVIDFSDMCFGDPAVDFGELHEYGLAFVLDVYERYKGPKDATFLDRAWTYQRWAGVYMMTDHFINQKTSFEEARELFDRVKANKPG